MMNGKGSHWGLPLQSIASKKSMGRPDFGELSRAAGCPYNQEKAALWNPSSSASRFKGFGDNAIF
jgi:hypothetical protein